MLRSQGDLKGARERFERALAIWEKVHGPEHPDTAISLSNLGDVLHRQDDLKGARARHERALAILERVHGPEHPDVGRVCRTLGQVYTEAKLWAPAEACFERTLTIAEKFPDAKEIAYGVPKLLKFVRGKARRGR